MEIKRRYVHVVISLCKTQEHRSKDPANAGIYNTTDPANAGIYNATDPANAGIYNATDPATGEIYSVADAAYNTCTTDTTGTE